ncbi:hypothetical protein JN01_0524 [Entomoplasma freundtii]|uniref:Uncharacterized protein n=1 Tax=Entomoplasma freundtii TaxID=74700 RepID=A0A2K8NQF7_9MOLU|nr:lipoprotein [Entomoplasma freundtii]ATZ16075.1 hypothetical protein EFREU_v1c00480 [Entomoplasma freundtii]TDY57023.1 hypothetical protein JN01_0524 [Entomoplasma freundtii]
MKKLLSILSSVGLLATTSATVVSCQAKDNENDHEEDIFAGDDFEVAGIKETWEIGAYNGTEIDPKTPKLWLNQAEFDSFKKGELAEKIIAEKIWTGMFDARHGASDEGTADSLKDFSTKKLWTVIHFTNLEGLKDVEGKWEPSSDNEKQFTLLKEESQKFGVNLDVDVISYTDVENPRQIGLEASGMTFINGLIINII